MAVPKTENEVGSEDDSDGHEHENRGRKAVVWAEDDDGVVGMSGEVTFRD